MSNILNTSTGGTSTSDEEESYYQDHSTKTLKSGYYAVVTGDKNITKGEVSPIIQSNTGSTNQDDEHIHTPQTNFLKKFLSIFLVCAIAFFMATTAELSQFIVSDSYKQPYTLVFFNTLFLMISFPIELVVLKISITKKKRGFKSTYTEYDPNESFFQTFKNQFTDIGSLNNNTTTTTTDSNGQLKKGHTFKKVAICSFFLSILFVGLNYIWMSALPMTEVSTSTALYQSATVFVFIFSIFILKEKVTILKTIPVILFIAGVIGITVADSRSKTEESEANYPNSTLGDILMIISAALWAVYEVLTTKFFSDANRTVVNTFIGLVGFFNLLFGIPMILILNATGAEPFTFPTVKIFGMLALNGFMGFGLNYLINWGLSITSPLFIRSGELMAIPATLLFDILFKHIFFPLIALPGFILIIAGFVMSIFLESKTIKEKELLEHQQQQQQQQQTSKHHHEDNEMNTLYL